MLVDIILYLQVCLSEMILSQAGVACYQSIKWTECIFHFQGSLDWTLARLLLIWLGSWKERVSLGICALGVRMIPWWSRSCRAGGYQLQDPQNRLAGIFSLLKYSKYWFRLSGKRLIFYSILFLSYHPVHFIPFLEASTIGLAVALRWRLWSTRLQVQKTNTNHITNRKTNRCRS